ncbi:AMP-binding protein [Magnetospirillum molischianum]|uniref:Putative acetyl-CoA synthetase n=1 Tax=Magnetospirillum molischianum DSM 120 TaxID=1150626 RepID=H8FQM9_MAGML|nr:AMP-binding protein [Magnetospirillum molischianum]CCG40667.1 putative acetyl-CoA synthetase [Magnetospirillum molischianum DSM 120]
MSEDLNAFLKARDFLVAHRSDYETAYRDFKWPVLTDFNWALDYFDDMAKGNHATALWLIDDDGETRLSFAQMSERSNRVANFLRAQGVRRGEAVLLMLNNVAPLWETMLACMKLGAVIIPATTLLVADDLKDRFERGGVRHVVAGSADTAKFEALDAVFTRIVVGEDRDGWTNYRDADSASADFVADAATHVNDTLLLYFTSGTTAKPKLVTHSYQSYPVGHLSTMYWIGLRPGDVHLNISSAGWAKHAWSNVFAPWNAGATVFVYNYGRFSAKAMLEAISRCGVTSMCAPPTVWRMLIQENLAAYPVKLRELVGAGEPLNPEVIERVKKAWNITIRDGYGQTETTCQIGNPPGQPVKEGSMGRPLPGYRVALLDLEDNPAQEGEISLALEPRPLGLMLGYKDDPEKTANLMRAGHYHCGDVACIDSDGYITYVGRTDDVFKASDYRISPFELESVLIEHEAVAEAAVVPSPDPLRLAVPKAFIVLRTGYQPSHELALSIFRHISTSLAPYKRIRRIEISDLPKTISGKIRRVELKRIEEQRRLQGIRVEGEYFEEDFADAMA